MHEILSDTPINLGGKPISNEGPALIQLDPSQVSRLIRYPRSLIMILEEQSRIIVRDLRSTSIEALEGRLKSNKTFWELVNDEAWMTLYRTDLGCVVAQFKKIDDNIRGKPKLFIGSKRPDDDWSYVWKKDDFSVKIARKRKVPRT